MGLPSIMSMADLATPMAIRVAATLNLAEHAADGATADQLAADTGASAPILRRLLDHLVTIGVFTLDDSRYRPTSLGSQLSDVKPLLDINRAGGRADLAFVELLHTITTGASAYTHRYGREFWADLDAQPSLRQSFDAQMAWRFVDHAGQIAASFPWGRFTSVVDAGGGDGNLLCAILSAHPGVRGTVVDLAPTTAPALARFAAAGIADRGTAVVGSFFDPLPAGADAYVLSDILHDWDDSHCRTILSRCRDAAGVDGTIVVIEPLIGHAGTAMDLFMLMCFGGRERTVDQVTSLASECGLVLRGTTPVSEGRTALEFSLPSTP
ncbi:methyltransferase [Kutzneria chonburiensis]|uniref:Methyltransferase n=1 Tax=Kutzneria chonburiensis TaxID=1483604 RepID=A0ABV6MJS8_9PSEU|nr:methyltransferase [Kutzneria chonburiensis]